MNPAHMDSVMGFNLDFLHPTTSNIPAQVLKQRYIGQIKRRIIRVDALHEHCKSLKLDICNKNKELEFIKNKLESTNQEHTQTSLEYKEILENYSKCEKECQNLKLTCRNYQEKYSEAEDRVEAGKSHIVQLQQLVAQHERKIDALENSDSKKKEKALRERLEKELLQWKKKHKKEIAEWQIKYDTLLKRVQDSKSVSGIPKNKQLSAKNNKISDEFISDVSLDGHSDNEEDKSVDFTESFDSSRRNIDMTHNLMGNKHVMQLEVDTDCRIESVSVDTGCGSSLASSENEKWLNSPEYGFFSPINGEGVDKIRERKLVDMASSPVLISKTTEIATSPIPSVLLVDVATSPITVQVETSNEIEPISESVINNMSPKPTELHVRNKVLTETNNNLTEQNENCSLPILEKPPDEVIHKKVYEPIEENVNQPMKILQTQEKHCLELNNSNNMAEDSNTDCEIQMIFNTMRLNHKLITPIPRTPKRVNGQSHTSEGLKAHTEDVVHCMCPDAAIARDLASAAREEAAQARRHIEKANENQAALIANFAKLMKEMIYVKTFLKSKFTTPGTGLDELPDSIQLTNLFEDTSTVNLNDDCHSLCAPAYLENSDTQMELVRSPINLTSAACSDITVIPEQIKVPIDTEHLNEKQHDDKDSSNRKVIPATESLTRSQSIAEELESESNSTLEIKKSKDKNVRKLSKLNSYRNKCEQQKYKIKRESPPLKKIPMKPKQVRTYGVRKLTTNDTSATLNDKQTYAKAVQVMAELNAVTPKKSKDIIVNVSPQQEKSEVHKHSSEIKAKPKKLPSRTSPRLSSEKTSPKPEINSPAPNITTTSPRRSARSLRFSNSSPVRATSPPEVTVTSPIQAKPSKKSSKLHDLFSTPAISSPTEKAYRRRSITSPRPSITSPRPSNTSPGPSITSPRPSITSPRQSITSPSPPPVTSPSPSITSPRPSITSPRPSITSPRPSITSPTPSITFPRRSPRLSESALLSPRSLPTSPNLDISSMRPLVTPLEFDTSLPDSHIESPIRIASPISPDMTIPKNCSKSKRRLFTQGALSHKDVSVTTSSVEKVARKRKLSDSPDIQSKRVLRSSKNGGLDTKEQTEQQRNSGTLPKTKDSKNSLSLQTSTNKDSPSWHIRESILCSMIQKYGIAKVKPVVKHLPDAVVKQISSTFEEYMPKIHDMPCNKENTMIELSELMKAYNYKTFVSGLIQYLSDSGRRMELFAKVITPPAPPITKSEAVLLFVLKYLQPHWQPVDIVEVLLSCIEHLLFKLNRTPDFGVIESMSHFYALVCRYFHQRNRLKAFMVDSMYCILYKSAALIKQCLEVFPHVIPLAHMGTAQTTLVKVLIYLLHFYKCDDRYLRVQEIRNILNRRYAYEITDWNEGKILEVVNNSIIELKDDSCEEKMLRAAIIMLAKRHGPRWTQHNIIKKLLQYIDSEKIPENVKVFCVWIIGPLMKPYPADMKVHCEIVLNQLLNKLNTTTSKRMEEVAITSLLIMSRHNTQKVNEVFLSRKLENMSPELEEMFRTYVRMKPLSVWLKTLSRPPTSK